MTHCHRPSTILISLPCHRRTGLRSLSTESFLRLDRKRCRAARDRKRLVRRAGCQFRGPGPNHTFSRIRFTSEGKLGLCPTRILRHLLLEQTDVLLSLGIRNWKCSCFGNGGRYNPMIGQLIRSCLNDYDQSKLQSPEQGIFYLYLKKCRLGYNLAEAHPNDPLAKR